MSVIGNWKLLYTIQIFLIKNFEISTPTSAVMNWVYSVTLCNGLCNLFCLVPRNEWCLMYIFQVLKHWHHSTISLQGDTLDTLDWTVGILFTNVNSSAEQSGSISHLICILLSPCNWLKPFVLHCTISIWIQPEMLPLGSFLLCNFYIFHI